MLLSVPAVLEQLEVVPEPGHLAVDVCSLPTTFKYPIQYTHLDVELFISMVLGDNDVHDDDDGSVKDKDHNQDGAHDIADADNNKKAAADPHLTVEDSCLNASGAEAGGCRGAMR